MMEMKQWYMSKTVWGGLIAILASVLQAMGLELDPLSQEQIADDLVSIAGAVGGLLAVYGRLTADKRLG